MGLSASVYLFIVHFIICLFSPIFVLRSNDVLLIFNEGFLFYCGINVLNSLLFLVIERVLFLLLGWANTFYVQLYSGSVVHG